MSTPLPAELVAFMQSGLSLLVGTRSADLMPETVRGIGVRIWPDACGLTVFVPAGNGARTLANVRDNGRIAITLSRPLTHETVQVKGTVTGVSDAAESDRPLLDAYLIAFAEVLGYCGLPHNVTRRLINWPAAAIDVAIEDVYSQTPGPGAGDRLASPSGYRRS